MKKIKTLICLACVTFSSLAMAQDEEESSYKSPMQKGNSIISVSFGYPNWGKFNLAQEFNYLNATNTSSSGFAPMGITAEHMLSKDISISFAGFVNSYGGKWQANKEIFNNGELTTENHQYEFSLIRYRFLVGLVYNISELEIDNFLFYCGAAVGANNFQFKESSTDNAWRLRNSNYFTWDSDNIELPISYRVNLGFRYFFKNNMVAHFDAGIGVPSINFGLGYKF